MKSGFSTIALLALAIGTVIGLGGYTFVYGKGFSYLTSDPAACGNCHVMKPQLDAWTASSHHTVAVCNDCHTPKNILGKYLVKAVNGFNHSYAFTAENFHEPIQIKGFNRTIAEQSCRNCHGSMWKHPSIPDGASEEVSCIRCHGSVGHQLSR